MYYKNVIEALGHTPLVEMSQLSPKPKVHILAKLEGQNLGGSASIKDRIAKYMIDRAELSGELTKEKTIIEATSGNTGIALAWLGHKKGYNVTIVMPENMSQERQQLIKIFGAELILTNGANGVQGAIDAAFELAAQDSKYFMPDQFSNPANPLTHYETTGVEILDDFPYDRIDFLIAGIGTGGTIVGVAKRLREKYPKLKAIGVEPPPGDSIQGLRCLEKYTPPILDLGLSSGAVAYHAIKIANEMDEGNIIAILPDGGWKYLSLDFWTKDK